ncbi:MAG: DNA recombination protein RmuC [Acidobacteria bacterium]|nr:DNA recombination protein RmuC [Acidobacteriota bacterium]
MTATAYLLLALAFGMGFLFAWLWATSRTRLQSQNQIKELGNALAGTASRESELRKQVEGLQRDLESSRARIDEEQTRRAAAETAVLKTQENLEEQRRVLEETKQKMSDAFQALASQALRTNAGQFLDLAKATFEALQKEASGDLSKREEAIKGLVNPLSNTLKSLDEKLHQVESSRQKAYGELTAQVEELAKTSQLLREETGSLVTSLRQPQIKGKWGELTLRRAAELTGMSPYCDFVEQPSVETEESRLRPDLIVNLPGGRQIVVDAKVPLHAFLKAISVKTAEDYRAAMSEHARLVRNHVAQLASRKYWDQFPQSPALVVLFLPGESFFSAALEQDHSLIEDARGKQVVLASPTTFIALLTAIGYGWRQERVRENAAHISTLGKELYERVVTFVEHIDGIRTGLERANKSYNTAVGSFEGRLLPAARKFKELGVEVSAEIPAVEPTETALRSLTASSGDTET